MATNHPSKNWINLAQASFGASVIEATDEFFGAKENLLNDSDPVFIPGKFTDQGKWMDGWEDLEGRILTQLVVSSGGDSEKQASIEAEGGKFPVKWRVSISIWRMIPGTPSLITQ